jgi:SAM-dependent methyltransferase
MQEPPDKWRVRWRWIALTSMTRSYDGTMSTFVLPSMPEYATACSISAVVQGKPRVKLPALRSKEARSASTLSAELLEIARRRARQEGLRNVGFEQGDAQVHAFPAAHFDLCISRFGVMFFADPAAAFANIGRAMRPGARLVMMVWQGQERNEWATAIPRAIAPGSVAPASADRPFALGDPAVATGILTTAGFASVGFAEVNEPVFYGPDLDAAYDAVIGLGFAKEALAGVDAAAADNAMRRLRAVLDAHLGADGVLFGSRAWIITAHRASS